MIDSIIVEASLREFIFANASFGSHLKRLGLFLFQVITMLDHFGFNSRLSERSLVRAYIVFLDTESDNELLDVHLFLLVLQVVLEILPAER